MESKRTSFLGAGVCAGMVAAFNLLYARTMRQPCVAFLTQIVGVLCGDLLSRTWPARTCLAKNSSVVFTCSHGKGHCMVIQYLIPARGGISRRTPLSTGNWQERDESADLVLSFTKTKNGVVCTLANDPTAQGNQRMQYGVDLSRC